MEDPSKDLFSGSRLPLPNGTTVFVLGICSVLFSCFFIGLILGIIGLVMSREGRRLYKDAPHLYEGHGLLNAGYILSIIGTALGALWIAYFIIIILFATGVGWNYMN
ncbi:MAG: CCC motif membrane protein [Flavisolibacter sp.]